MCIVDTQNDEALACGSIVEELHRRLPRQCGHRVFSIEVKRAAIARVLEDGRDVREVAAALELSHASLQRWVAQALASQPTMVTEPAAWLQLPHPLDCHGPGDPEPIQPPPPPEEAPPPPEQAPPPQEFPPVSVPEAEPPSPPEQAPLPQEFPLGGMRLANRRGDIAHAFVAATKWPTQR
ncbi:MAG: transposase [Kofleriaceae bacterium]|nr:transposase [Kofleriaceae bacterium]